MYSNSELNTQRETEREREREREHHCFSCQSLLHHLTQKPLAHPKSQTEVVLKSDGQEFIHMEIWRESVFFKVV